MDRIEPWEPLLTAKMKDTCLIYEGKIKINLYPILRWRWPRSCECGSSREPNNTV